ncbi:TPA: hypothetical protein NIG71_005952 [Pseudomonas aeruginosa]|uniref:hypothetical protein n=1 Tax=Pseudomonas aeruginosa TaxID=287 RepID=UPI001D0AFA8C|nr:hypothetical protein [Pseudomonas aeruginosa]MCC0195976.1 hypothetical protein [Pseudomonas aeruginosa]MCC0227910.1 hypothetical protein [Pseudomonas aeruginosa]MCC0454606.1 hypothetical protein [Pseudomonas aeruginosa]HCF5363401.1 hypothetical protein [Pseudomonas aeruginosa]HCF5364446.1 hypothetical protein [Pseudomonas aeruginosa]
MSFTRTKSGLSNLGIFYGSDLIIFTEGGKKSFTKEEVEAGQYNTISIDIKFWKSVLEAHGLERTVSFRAVGSKTCSKSICEKIITGQAKNIAVAKDSDLDEFLGLKQRSPYILYTKGYSWENDVFSKDLVSEQIESLALLDNIPDEISKLIEQCYSDYENVGTRLAKLEIIFRKHGIKFISEFNGERFINSKAKPKINIQQVKQLIEQNKEKIQRPVSLPPGTKICAYTNIYGKLLESLAFAVICFISKKYLQIKDIPKEIIGISMLEKYKNKITAHPDTYYTQIVSELNSAKNLQKGHQ